MLRSMKILSYLVEELKAVVSLSHQMETHDTIIIRLRVYLFMSQFYFTQILVFLFYHMLAEDNIFVILKKSNTSCALVRFSISNINTLKNFQFQWRVMYSLLL